MHHRFQSGLLGLLTLTGTAAAQTFIVRANGGNNLGYPPASCAYDLTASQPLAGSGDCSTFQATWTGATASDRGVVYSTSYAEYHELGLWTLGAEYNETSYVSVSDLVVSGPAAGSVTVTANFDLTFASSVDPGGWGQASASASAMVWLGGFLAFNDQNFTTQGTRHIGVSRDLPPNAPMPLAFKTDLGARAMGPADNGIPHASGTVVMRFAIGEPALVVPPGYTVNCPSLNIVNGYWLGPTLPQTPAMTYGTAKVNSLGCTPNIGSSGTPSASVATPFLVTASNVLNNRSGLMFYGFAPDNQPFQGGFKLVANPTQRTGVQSSGGNPSPDDCSGAYSFDMNARIRSGADANLVAGTHVYCQYWSRDPASASSTGLTDALAFLIGP